MKSPLRPSMPFVSSRLHPRSLFSSARRSPNKSARRSASTLLLLSKLLQPTCKSLLSTCANRFLVCIACFSKCSLTCPANAKFILASHQGRTPFEGGRSERGRPERSITVVTAQYGSHVLASVVSLDEPMGAMDAPVLALLTGPPDASATDALQGLLEVPNLAVARVCKDGFCDLKAPFPYRHLLPGAAKCGFNQPFEQAAEDHLLRVDVFHVARKTSSTMSSTCQIQTWPLSGY